LIPFLLNSSTLKPLSNCSRRLEPRSTKIKQICLLRYFCWTRLFLILDYLQGDLAQLFVLMIANRQSKQNQKVRKNNCVEYIIPLQPLWRRVHRSRLEKQSTVWEQIRHFIWGFLKLDTSIMFSITNYKCAELFIINTYFIYIYFIAKAEHKDQTNKLYQKNKLLVLISNHMLRVWDDWKTKSSESTIRFCF